MYMLISVWEGEYYKVNVWIVKNKNKKIKKKKKKVEENITIH